MESFIQLDSDPVQATLKILLQDKTTKENIKLNDGTIQPRILKDVSQQVQRTRKNAEVFTPAWVCNRMNNFCDAEWFGYQDVFNRQAEQKWIPTGGHVKFPDGRTWKAYVDSRRLEITCGEAPYLVSRYDVSTGAFIEVCMRIGILDRKLRIVNENAADEAEWMKWAVRAFQSVYGYEYQGDNLLIARINLLMTFVDYLDYRWHRQPEKTELRKVANIISWNIWQMDGLKGTAPGCEPAVPCRLYDWRGGRSVDYSSERRDRLKFDLIIGNPPYQDKTIGDNKGYAPPIYHKFLENAYKLCDVVEMIHPARFLFDAGSTPKQWNERMLQDPHLDVLYFEQDSDKVFGGTDIKGGVAVTYHDKSKEYGAVGIFTAFDELNSILKKVKNDADFTSFSSIVVTRTAYRLTGKMHEDHPEALGQLSNGHAHDMSTNIFERLPQIFFDERPQDGAEYIQILGRERNGRVHKFVRRDYVNTVSNLDKYKIFLPKANGIGALGEVLSAPVLCGPMVGATETFLSIGAFGQKEEAEAALKYIKTKFARVLLGVLKTTQDITPEKWKCVPLQDFTAASDINWMVSIADIDRQLYKKYKLSGREINFIETRVKEMA